MTNSAYLNKFAVLHYSVRTLACSDQQSGELEVIEAGSKPEIGMQCQVTCSMYKLTSQIGASSGQCKPLERCRPRRGLLQQRCMPLLFPGVGICVMCGPLFLSELAPAHLRGAFNTQFQVRQLAAVLAAADVSSIHHSCVEASSSSIITQILLVAAVHSHESGHALSEIERHSDTLSGCWLRQLFQSHASMICNTEPTKYCTWHACTTCARCLQIANSK